ncbi:MAG: TonB-dependent receptor [Acidobacteriaceae bacterium]|nr:TonB-dependent receptor [Acidobacteriaceae bacterium]
MVALTGTFALIGQSRGADLSLPVTGNVLGTVSDANSTPQMGATVELFNKYQRLLAKTISAPNGQFAFPALPADIYSVRVSLASFLPVSRDRVAVKPGVDSVLQIHLATLFSNIEVTYTVPTGAMTEDWKWVLRSSPATRPINRIFDEDTATPVKMRPKIFSDTRAMLTVSGGDGGLLDSDTVVGDLGTGFSLTTNFLGKNQLQLAGTFGSGPETGPGAMSLCAIYTPSRRGGGIAAVPEVTMTMAQFGRFGSQPSSGDFTTPSLASSAPALRSISLSFYNTADLFDNIHLEYGTTGESVDFGQQSLRVSPFVRATVDLGSRGEVLASYSDGGRPDALMAHQEAKAPLMDAGTTDLANAVGALSRIPQISERNGQLQLQRAQDYEVGYKKVIRSRTYAVSAFYEDVTNGRINVAGDVSDLPREDLLSDGMSMTSAYNIGAYRRMGYVTSVEQRVTDTFHVALAFGRMGGFTADSEGVGQITDSYRGFLQETNHNVANANLGWRAPVTGTQLIASYGWADTGAVIPQHAFTTQSMYVAPGFNLSLRQPVPTPFGMPGHFELTADVRNLLAQGYIPMASSSGGHMLIVQSPRAIRGGLNFVF